MRAMLRPLILIHIPKTAGTTLSRMLRLHFALQPANWLRHARTLGYYHMGYARAEHLDARLRRIAELPPACMQHVMFFAAHAGFGLRDRLPGTLQRDAAYITVLREPLARVLSTFHHLRTEGRLPRDASLIDYVDQRKHFGLFKFDNCQTRYLAGEGGVAIDVPCGSLSRESLEIAKTRLERDVHWFGVTERFDESVLMLADALAWRRPRYVRARVAKADTRTQDVDEGLLRRIRELNTLDIELYDFALRILDQRIAAMGASFAQRVEQFRIANVRHATIRAPISGLLPGVRSLLQRAGLLK